MISRLHHVATVCSTIEAGVAVWRDWFGLRVGVEATVPSQGVRAVLLPCGDGEIELLEPLDAEGAIARFGKRGGVHHVCFESSDVAAELAALQEAGVRLIDKVPRPGLAGSIGFVHPKSVGGTLLELATPGGGVASSPYADPQAKDPFLQVIGYRHLSWITTDITKTIRQFADLFGLEEVGPSYEVPELGTVARGVRMANAEIELVTPSGEGWAADRLAARGEGACALALEVADFADGIERLQAAGVQATSCAGAGGETVWMLDPAAVQGVQISLRETSR